MCWEEGDKVTGVSGEGGLDRGGEEGVCPEEGHARLLGVGAGARAVRRCSRWPCGEVQEGRCQAQTALELLQGNLLLSGDSSDLDQAEEEGGEAGVEAGEQ